MVTESGTFVWTKFVNPYLNLNLGSKKHEASTSPLCSPAHMKMSTIVASITLNHLSYYKSKPNQNSFPFRQRHGEDP